MWNDLTVNLTIDRPEELLSPPFLNDDAFVNAKKVATNADVKKLVITEGCVAAIIFVVSAVT